MSNGLMQRFGRFSWVLGALRETRRYSPGSILARREPREDLVPVFGMRSPPPVRQKLAPDPRVAARRKD
jgi:hypothetical protein